MKKICCSLLLLLFTFVCLFAIIPKNKVSADTIVQDSTDYDLPYLMPTIINYRFGNSVISTTPDYVFSLDLTSHVTDGGSLRIYDSQILTSTVEHITSMGLLESNLDVADYWSRYDNSKDNKYYLMQEFSTLPSSSSGDLVITMVFTNISLNYQFIVDYNDTNLLMFEHPFQANNYNIDLDFVVSYPHDPFSYTNNNGQAVVGSRFDSYEIDATINEFFGYHDPISLDVIKMLEIENRNIMQNNPTTPIILNGTLKITIPNWEQIVSSNTLSFQFDVITHPFSSYIEYPDKVIGVYPGPLFFDYYRLGRGLPVACSECPSCEDNPFIEDISTSLLNGVQNFLTFEISPGFSLYHILLLVVAIPLLILILKLFLGG